MRVAVVHDDLDTTRIFRYLLADSGHELAWTAATGAAAIKQSKNDLPDLILLKLALDDMPGAEITKAIMDNNPTTIIVVSKSVKRNPAKVFEVMSAGALDAVSEPSTEDPDSLQTLKHKIENINKLHKSLNESRNKPGPAVNRDIPLVAIGASTGGPAALVNVLSGLPQKPNAVIVIIQHMDVQFSKGMARWIDEQTDIHVEIAKAGLKPKTGIAYIAGTEDHLILNQNGCFDYTPDPVDYPYRPSVDVFFESAVTHWPNELIGVLLTGMGRDGANGLLSFYNRGMLTIAQDKDSCAVYGMPKAAVELNAATKVLPIDDIAAAINKAILNKA
ncbi:MAG: chemotaxis-specific protein-glutamate methyltransferase CheB [Gammaproteobacteria bacterium]|nr:chemotaxis-specific protein-glutamate methyltransferase CheB [Gammaproteobacteria bacterium]